MFHFEVWIKLVLISMNGNNAEVFIICLLFLKKCFCSNESWKCFTKLTLENKKKNKPQHGNNNKNRTVNISRCEHVQLFSRALHILWNNTRWFAPAKSKMRPLLRLQIEKQCSHTVATDRNQLHRKTAANRQKLHLIQFCSALSTELQNSVQWKRFMFLASFTLAIVLRQTFVKKKSRKKVEKVDKISNNRRSTRKPGK